MFLPVVCDQSFTLQTVCVWLRQTNELTTFLLIEACRTWSRIFFYTWFMHNHFILVLYTYDEQVLTCLPFICVMHILDGMVTSSDLLSDRVYRLVLTCLLCFFFLWKYIIYSQIFSLNEEKCATRGRNLNIHNVHCSWKRTFFTVGYRWASGDKQMYYVITTEKFAIN